MIINYDCKTFIVQATGVTQFYPSLMFASKAIAYPSLQLLYLDGNSWKRQIPQLTLNYQVYNNLPGC